MVESFLLLSFALEPKMDCSVILPNGQCFQNETALIDAVYGADRRLMFFSWCFNEKYNVAFACFGTVPVSAGVECPYSRRDAVTAKARKKNKKKKKQ